MEIALQKPQGIHDWLRVQRLYHNAFPRAERKPFSRIRQMFREGKADVWCILADGRFAGLATTVNSTNLVLIDYFAVTKRLRSHGIGRAAMECLLSVYADRGVFLEIESTDRPGLDLEQRIRRKGFYCSCGFTDLAVKAKVFGVYMELLGIRCQLNFDGYKAFYRDNYSGWAADHLEEVK